MICYYLILDHKIFTYVILRYFLFTSAQIFGSPCREMKPVPKSGESPGTKENEFTE